jgi:hypothetical protein
LNRQTRTTSAGQRRKGLLDGTLTVDAVETMLRELEEEYGERDVIRNLRDFIERRRTRLTTKS